MAELAQREESASLSFSQEEEDDGHPAPLMNTFLPNHGPRLKATQTKANRAEFLKAAPSLMKLITVAQTPKPSPLFDQSSYPDTEELDASQANGRRSHNAHVKMPTVINNVLNAFEENHDDSEELQQLALKAAKEFQILTAKNDELFREKEQFRTKYDDTQQSIQELEEKLADTDIYRDENEKLQSVNGSLAVQIQVFQQEKAILEDTINDLKTKNRDIMKDFELRRSSSQDTDNNDTASIPIKVVKSENEERLMAKVSQMTKEKNDLEAIFDSLKAEINNKNKNISALQQQLSSANNELGRVTNSLSQTTEKYISLEQSNNQQRRKYTRKLTIQSESMVDEHIAKQKQLDKVIAIQKKRIHELEAENQELTNYKYSGNKKRESKKMNHLRLRTKQDIFGGGELYDMDPFGPDADDEDDGYMMNEAGSGLSEDDELNPGPTFHGTHDGMEQLPGDSTKSNSTQDTHDTQDGFIMPAKRDETASLQVLEMNAGKCGCFRNIFNKRSNIQRLSNSEPLAVQEMR